MRFQIALVIGCILSLQPTNGEARSSGSAPTKAITADALIKLRDIGPVPADSQEDIFTLSPDGSRVAFQIREADTRSNTYKMTMQILDLESPLHVLRVDEGGQYIQAVFPSHGLAAFVPSGISKVITPSWSPDGKAIAYLRRDSRYVQVWQAASDGSGAAPLTTCDFDIDGVRWLTRNTLVVWGRPGLEEARQQIILEGDSGFLYDDRFVPSSSNRPFPRGPISETYFVIDLISKEMKPATPSEIQQVVPVLPASLPVGAVVLSFNENGDASWSLPTNATDIRSPQSLYARVGGRTYACQDAVCDRVVATFWYSSNSLYYLRREGWAHSQTALYRWDLSKKIPMRVYVTDDVLIGCKRRGDSLICGHEGSLQPRDLISVRLNDGAIKSLYDPNPELKAVRLGSVQRLRWKSPAGVEAFGDLVLPPDHVDGERHPLIVVQYRTRGFLRGGTGDEYPIQLLAAHGFAVLSFDSPPSVSATSGAASWEAAIRSDTRDWTDRRHILATLNLGIDLVISKGAIDPDRIGITGLSDGASTVEFAVLNSDRFKAAAMSSCCHEPGVTEYLAGPTIGGWFETMGYPPIDKPDPSFWRGISFRVNAARMKVPLLLQLPDAEYLAGVEGYTALRASRAPVEMYVFPDETHMKWQPAHREAQYERAVDWFDFWLFDREDAAPNKKSQYERWRTLRSENQSTLGASPGQ